MRAILLLLLGTCLVTSSPLDDKGTRIINGNNAKDGEYPFIVSLRKKAVVHFCGGSIISDRWVLTAAHCLLFHPELPTTVVAGSIDKQSYEYVYNVVHLVLHEEYNKVSQRNDIGLLKVEVNFNFEMPWIKKVNIHANYIGGNELVEEMGWGTTLHPTNTLQKLYATTLSLNDCANRIVLEPYTLCVYNSTSRGMCNGDSGSPMVLAGTNQQIGIASYVVRNCSQGFPDVYTRVSDFVPWIVKHID